MYDKSITRRSRALFVIAIDQSCSMMGEILIAGERVTKAKVVADVANELLAELVERSRRCDGVRDYYDVAVVGYSGDGVSSLLDDELVSITLIDQKCKSEVDIDQKYRMDSGKIHFIRRHIRQWIEPKATGSTPMYESLLTIYDLVGRWCCKSENQESFPPLIFNITDGESTDCDYDDVVAVASKIKSLATYDGNALLINVHIASDVSDSSLLFPSPSEFTSWATSSKCAESLYSSASEMPPIFNSAISEIKDSNERAPFKGVCYNCSVAELITILNIGSISVKRS